MPLALVLQKPYYADILPWKEGSILAHGGNPFRYEQHALARMSQRGVSRVQIELAVRAPNWTAPADRDGRRKVVKRIGKRSLAIIVEETPDFMRVISTWWIE